MREKLISLIKRKDGNQNCYLNYMDLLMPFNGCVSAHQCIIISRILDIERFQDGKDFFWQRRLSRLDGLENLEDRDLEKLDSRFSDLLSSLQNNGYDTGIGNIVVSKHPIELLNGTHRLAWITLFEKKLEIPCVSVDDYSIFPVDGFRWLESINLPEKEIRVIKERYDKLLADNEYCLSAIVSNDIYDLLINEISKYFFVYGKKLYNSLTKEKKSELIKICGNNLFCKIAENNFCLVNLKLSSQLLMMEQGVVKSVVICSLERRLNIISCLKDRYWIAHTVADSMRIMKIIQEDRVE